MGMSLQAANAQALQEARRRAERDGRQAQDRCIEEYLALAVDHPRRRELNRVISVLSLI
jgi:hypothetical protein